MRRGRASRAPDPASSVFDLYGSDRWVHDEPMQSDATTVQEYLAGLPEDRREAITAVRDTVNSHLPDGYEETLQFGMITWSIPLAAYPNTTTASLSASLRWPRRRITWRST